MITKFNIAMIIFTLVLLLVGSAWADAERRADEFEARANALDVQVQAANGEAEFYRGVYATCIAISRGKGLSPQVAIPACLRFKLEAEKAKAFTNKYPGLDTPASTEPEPPKVLQDTDNA